MPPNYDRCSPALLSRIPTQRDTMYTPTHFEETRTEVLHQLVRTHPLATLVTLSPDGLVANYVPLLYRPSPAGLGALVGHVARSNLVWNATNFEVPVLALFQGPQLYISPSLYATKQEHGKVVPTWNYVVVQARGLLTVHDDAQWIRQQVTELTQQQEAARPQPWAVDDAPRDYTDTMIKAIVGIEITLMQLNGKWKVSQNQPAVNQASIIAGLRAEGTPDAQTMAALVANASKR